MRGSNGTSGRRLRFAFGIVVIVALLTGAVGATAQAGSGSPIAVAAKKKCKKHKSSRSASAAKKKKCKKKKGPTPVSLVRATLTWGNAGSDLDLWVFGPNATSGKAGVSSIPNAIFSPNVTAGPATETFTDTAYVNPGGRQFSYGVCQHSGGTTPNITLDYVTADGVHHTLTGSLSSASGTLQAPVAGGPTIPASNTWCP